MVRSRLPFRWDLVARDQLGTLLVGCAEPSLWYLGELVRCAARVVARSGGGDLVFVGRSADSVFDLLSGALAGTAWAERLQLLPLSLRGVDHDLTARELGRLRVHLADAGLDPRTLARRRRVVVFVDLVCEGLTFGSLHRVLRRWVDQERASWEVIRRLIRFVGITVRTKTSPNTWRWHQHADWTRELPARAVSSVSLDPQVWRELGDHQPKLTPSFRREHWWNPSLRAPRHDARTRTALAEAVALVERGREPAIRRRLAAHLAAEPAFADRWLRALALDLRGTRRRR